MAFIVTICPAWFMAHGNWHHVCGLLMHPIDEAIAEMQERRWRRECTIIRLSHLQQLRHRDLLRLAQERQIFGRTTMSRPALVKAIYASEYGAMWATKNPAVAGYELYKLNMSKYQVR